MLPNKDYPYYLKLEDKIGDVSVSVDIRANTDDFISYEKFHELAQGNTVEEIASAVIALVVAPEAEVIASQVVGAMQLSAYAVKSIPSLPHPQIFAEASL